MAEQGRRRQERRRGGGGSAGHVCGVRVCALRCQDARTSGQDIQQRLDRTRGAHAEPAPDIAYLEGRKVTLKLGVRKPHAVLKEAEEEECGEERRERARARGSEEQEGAPGTEVTSALA
eukprot:107224-Rhodomonas_salina.3